MNDKINEEKKQNKKPWIWIVMLILIAVLCAETWYLYTLHKKQNVRSVSSIVKAHDPRGAVDVWDPFQELNALHRGVNRLFEQSFQRAGVFGKPGKIATDVTAFAPDADIEETDNEYVIEIDIPGIAKTDINVEINGNQLIVSGERKSTNELKKEELYTRERRFGYFSRTFPLPYDADASQIQASYQDGVLIITLAKAPVEGKGKKEITVN